MNETTFLAALPALKPMCQEAVSVVRCITGPLLSQKAGRGFARDAQGREMAQSPHLTASTLENKLRVFYVLSVPGVLPTLRV